MISRLLVAILNGIITWIVLNLVVALLVMAGLAAASIISPFIYIIAVIVAILTFLGTIPNYWNGIVR
jgi:Kef-type K+ transport system membrane component KefB